MTTQTLLEEWRALLERRPNLRASLAPYEQILAAWTRRADSVTPLRWTAAECRERWARGIPLLAEAVLTLPRDSVEHALGEAARAVSRVDPESLDGLRRLAAAWDAGHVRIDDFFPGKGRVGTLELQEASGLSQETLAVLACATLRPVLTQVFSEIRAHLDADVWDGGVCPFCGGPPGFADVVEDGRRRLACHVCAGEWYFARLRCPYCGHQGANEFVRLQAEAKDEGYAITACKSCGGYLKEVDRRARWNAGPALIEDWGTPHLDLIAVRAGYWRPLPSLLQLAMTR